MHCSVRAAGTGLCVGLALLLGCAKPAPRKQVRGPAVSVAIGAASPDQIGVTPAGERIEIAQFRGKLVLLSFWATWCAPCRKELPRLEEFHRAYQDNGLEIVAVNYGEKPEQIDAFLKANPQLTLRIVVDPTAETAQRFGVTGLPTSVILDWNGVVRWAKTGYGDGYQQELLGQLNALVAELQHPNGSEPQP